MTLNKQDQNNNPATILEFSRLQLAAEALYGFKDAKPNFEDSKGVASAGNLVFNYEIKPEHLMSGNDHNSKFTPTDAAEFVENWEMVAHIANTTTGFSGSLFRAKKDIPGTDIKRGDLTISFRSTEFVDDATRDSQATNTFEIADRGWAFGQISDMVRWVRILQERGLIDRKLNVTGYSLGGHLATAFNLLQRGTAFDWQDKKGQLFSLEINSTYTFNGAGVGLQSNEEVMNPGKLAEIIDNFSRDREKGRMAYLFDKTDAKEFYLKLGLALDRKDRSEFESVMTEIKSIIDLDIITYGEYTQNLREFLDLKLAGEKILEIWKENLRVKNLSSLGDGKGDKPQIIDFESIAALGLDYQLAVIMANKKTKNVAKFFGKGSGLNNIFSNNRNVVEVFENFYDIYGDTFPSMVASSQLHYGESIGVAIEN